MVELDVGFLPLTDSAILIAAREFGFAEENGIALNLVRETSWANIRDRLAIGHFNVAHALAPMPIAANLRLTHFDAGLIAPMALGLGGNAITLRSDLMAELRDEVEINPSDASIAGTALAKLVKARAARGKAPLQFAVVHPFSGHNFELRYWLAASGIEPDRDVEIVILPPPFMPDALAAQQIDGFCVGEPWNTGAVSKGVGEILTIKSAIWASSPEKVLAVRETWQAENPETMISLLQALYRAAQWCGDDKNKSRLAATLSAPHYLGVPEDQVLPAIDNTIMAHVRDQEGLQFFEPFDRAATFPWQSHALWFYSQMVRWGHVAHSATNAEIARSSFRPDLYREAMMAMDAPVPAANSKVEGALKQTEPVGVSSSTLYLGPDGFFDGEIFDPENVDDYITRQNGGRTSA